MRLHVWSKRFYGLGFGVRGVGTLGFVDLGRCGQLCELGFRAWGPLIRTQYQDVQGCSPGSGGDPLGEPYGITLVHITLCWAMLGEKLPGIQRRGQSWSL